MVSRLHAKTNQIGKILNNLEKYNLMKDLEIGRSPSTPGSTKSFLKTSPLSPKPPPFGDRTFAHRSFDEQGNKNRVTVDRGAVTPSAKDESKIIEAEILKSAGN